MKLESIGENTFPASGQSMSYFRFAAGIQQSHTLKNLPKLLWFEALGKMVDAPIVGVLTWFHIISVIGWSGAALTFLVAVGPSLKKLSPQANSEIALKMFPRYVRTIQVFTVLTLIFGPLLAFTMNALNDVGGPNAFDLVSPWSRFITAGASIGITTFFLVFLVFTPTANGLGRLIQKMQQNPQQPPPAEFGRLQKRLAILGPLAVTLLLSAEVFMVIAALF